jgi:hypothetical protein
VRQGAARALRASGKPDTLPDATEEIGATDKPKKGAAEAKPASNGAATAVMHRENPRQGRHPAEQIADQAPKTRGEDGKFKPEVKVNRFDQIARQVVRKHLGLETDAAALDSVKPKGQSPKVEPDRAPESDATTEATDDPEQTSLEATRTRRAANPQLKSAQQALELEGWTEAELASLPDNRILALGKRAKDLQSEQGRKLRESKQTTNGTAPDPAAETDGTTEREEPESRDKPATQKTKDYTPLATKHFGDDPQYDTFRKSLAAYSNDLLQSDRKDRETELANLGREVESKIRAEMMFDRACEKLSAPDRFPQLATPAGTARILPYLEPMLRSGLSLDQAIEKAATAEFAEENEKGKKKTAATKAESSARDSGQIKTNGRAPTQKDPTTKDFLTSQVRKFMGAS